MKRKATTKSIAKRRRYGRLRKLKAAALSLGLATAWGGTTDAATTFTATATATITLANSAYVVDDRNGGTATATATIDIQGIGGPPTGGADSGSATIPQNIVASSGGGYYYIGTSGSDLVLSFPNGGAGAIGTFWGAIFVDPVGGGLLVSEQEILAQLPFLNGQPIEPGSPLDRLHSVYGQQLSTPYGQEATLVAFTNNTAGPNHGIFGGTTSVTIVPEPATWAIVAMATGVMCVGVRRRE